MASAKLDEIIENVEKHLNVEKHSNVEKHANVQKPAKAEKKKDKKTKAPKPVVEQPEITKLDIRVGKIVNVWKHETADKLYCEEIDVGEDTVRNIASGLVPHYSLEEMKDRRCLVLCNLKARNLVGFKSHGMVLCAAKAVEGQKKELVAFVEPPEGAKIGERVVFTGLEGEPISPAQVEKKKVLVKLNGEMKTDENGVAKWKDIEFGTSAGPCTATKVPLGDIR